VQATGIGNPIWTRGYKQVVRVPQHKLVANFSYLTRFKTAYGRLGRQGDESWGLNFSVRGVKHARAGAAVSRLDLELQSLGLVPHARRTLSRGRR
jgi:hypothetical protein